MCLKLVKGRNYKKFKLSYQTKINIKKRVDIGKKLKRKKWYFFRFKNNFRFFPRIRKISKVRFFL